MTAESLVIGGIVRDYLNIGVRQVREIGLNVMLHSVNVHIRMQVNHLSGILQGVFVGH
jgi:hypothetical protein